jgi:tetratricopeptide (TPR) repeat protein
MTGRLIHAMRQLDADVTVEELTDALWLLGEIHRRLSVDPSPSRPVAEAWKPSRTRVKEPEHPSTTTPPDTAEPPAVESPTVGGDPPPATPPRSSDAVAEWRLPRHDKLLDGPAQVPVRSPGAVALRGTLAMGRALRPLRRRLPSRTAVVLDEEGTVRQAADGDLWVPASRPALDRWLDLSIVVDDSDSMVIWRRTATEFRELMERMGAFRDIRVWRCDSDLRGGEKLTVRPEGVRSDSPGRDVRELIDPTGRRAVLLVSDCVGRAWTTGAISHALRVWGGAGPVAIVQVLPPRLWDACGPAFVPVRLRARRPGAPNAELRVRIDDAEQIDDAVPGAMPVPVLALESRWFAPWASMVSGTGSDFVAGTAIFPGGAWQEPMPVRPPIQSADDLLEHYASFASTEALSLAKYLAGAPLSLPVMRLIQRAMLPESRPSVLAEVFLGGLLRRQARLFDTPMDPDEITYDFAPGVRERLLSALPRGDKVAVLARVSDFIAARLGSPVDFRAFLNAADSAADLLQRDPPFARVALQVLRDIGGRYGEAATALHHKAVAHVAEDRPEPEMADEPTRTKDSQDASAAPLHSDSGRPVVVPTPSTEPAPDTSVQTSRQPRVFGNVPYQNPNFTGRRSLLKRLHQTLTQGTGQQAAVLPHALHGMGGVGKTQLAVEYVYRYASEYDLVWWVPAESITTVRASLAQLAERLGQASADVSQAINNALTVLRAGDRYRRWLVVFDNADRPEDLREYLPRPGGHVLVTSRNAQWADVAAQLEVDVFEREESIALLRRRGRGISSEEAHQLAEKLGDLPLALDQAAAWQAETGMPVEEMIRLLDQRMRQLLDEHPPTTYPATVMATWDLAFNRLRERSPGAAQLLELCAFFGSEPIAVSLLWDGRHAALPDPVERVLEDHITLRRAIREMNRYALAKVDQTRDRIEVHRLVQAVLRERMTSEQRETARDAVHSILAMANPGDPDNPRNWERHAQLSPHVTSSGVVDAKTDAARRVALDQIRYRFIRGDSLRCSSMGERVVQRWRNTLGPDHELTLIAQRHLAVALRELGELERAAALNQETLQRLRAVFGEDHEHTLNTANSVGYDLRLRGEFRDAKVLDEENLDHHRRVFAHDDPETLRAMNNVAVDLRLLGDFAGALALDSETHALNQTVLGNNHPATFMSLANLARDHFDAGRYSKAQELLDDALPRMEELLAENSREMLIAKRIFVIVQRRLGAHREARELAEELYSGARRFYPSDHERMLSMTVTYTNTLLSVGEFVAARSLADQALQRYRHRYGDRHPFSLASAVNLGIIMRTVGEPKKARELDETALPTLRQELGDDHPYTLCALLSLAIDCAGANDDQRARALSKEAYDSSRETRGEDHPDTLICALNHSLDLHAGGDLVAAEALRGAALPQLRRQLGDNHPQPKLAANKKRIEGDIEIWDT